MAKKTPAPDEEIPTTRQVNVKLRVATLEEVGRLADELRDVLGLYNLGVADVLTMGVHVLADWIEAHKANRKEEVAGLPVPEVDPIPRKPMGRPRKA